MATLYQLCSYYTIKLDMNKSTNFATVGVNGNNK